MAHWLDRLAIAVAEGEHRTISRREALRGGGRLAGAAIVGSTVAGVAAPSAAAAGNSYCLKACLATVDNGFNHYMAFCKAEYLDSRHFPADAIDEVNCVAHVHRALKVGKASCREPFCGDRKRYPPQRRPVPVPKHVPPPKPPPPPAGGHPPPGPCGSGFGCGPGVCCDPDQLCCTKDNFGQVLQFCVPRNNPAGACHGALSGPV
jgi:hypothetical protein